jgi:hypothetical protein
MVYAEAIPQKAKRHAAEKGDLKNICTPLAHTKHAIEINFIFVKNITATPSVCG